MRIRIAEDADELADRAADEFLRRVQEGVVSHGAFRVALAGGNTPRSMYRLLAEDPRRDEVAWPRTQIFFGDERHVPPDHPDSNFRMAYETLLSKVPIPLENVYRYRSEEAGAGAVATAYERTLTEVFGLKQGEIPRFDLVVLGLGTDGHTASLFPGSEALRENDRLVAAPWVEKLGSHRLTLTPRVLNNAAHVLFLVSGSEKAETLRQVLEGQRNPEELPAQIVEPAPGQVLWLVDRAAAERLQRA